MAQAKLLGQFVDCLQHSLLGDTESAAHPETRPDRDRSTEAIDLLGTAAVQPATRWLAPALVAARVYSWLLRRRLAAS